MGEFELIRHYFQPLAEGAGQDQLVLGPGDDCAIQRVPPGRDLVFSVDTLIEGVHFPLNYSSSCLGWRALAVAVSDLAAMGADPVCFTLALSLPQVDHDWLAGFGQGLARASDAFNIRLAGGDTTRGPLTITVQVHGTVPQGRALLRSGAQPGDKVCVSGCLGNAGAALDYLDLATPDALQAEILASYHQPCPQLGLGAALAGKASAAIDISDGLLADLQHILAASGVGAELDAGAVPLSPALRQLQPERALDLALTAGDDYQLCVTIAPAVLAGLPAAIRGRLSVIGTIVPGTGVALKGSDRDHRLEGYDHFRRPD